MILPRSRLLWWAGVWLVPAAILAAAAPALAELAYAAAALGLLVPVFDAVFAGRTLAGLGAVLPAEIRLTKGADGRIELRISNDDASARRIRVGLPLPAELGCLEEDFDVALPAGAQWSTVAFECFPSRRGKYVIDRCYVGAASGWGFWLKRRVVSARAEVRVYPSLVSERKRLSALFLTRGGFGVHAQRQVGQGRDFEKLRDYIRGDPYNEIHWKATAKRHQPATKVFQLERTQEVYVIIDSSRLSARVPDPGGEQAPGAEQPAPVVTALERFVTAALIMGLVAERQGDLFGVASYSDRVDRFVRARNGRGHYRACRDALYALQPAGVTPDFSELFTFIRMRLRRRALLVFLTSLEDPIVAEGFAESIPLIARQHLVLVNMIQPPGVGPVFADPAAAALDDVYEDLGGHLQWHRLRELAKTLQHQGVQFHLVANETLCPELVSQYIGIKRRQLL